MANEFRVKNGLIVDGDSTLRGKIYDVSGSTGTSGQLLSSTSNGILWVSASTSTSLTPNFDYIDFTTGYTATTKTGRVYYDTTEKALSFFPDQTQNVVVRVGQQLYTRVNNITGSDIPKGSVITLQSASNGLPNATLALAQHDVRCQVAGLAADTIPNGGVGLVLNNGLLTGLSANTFNIGDVLYLSDSTPGAYVAGTSSFSLAKRARTNEIGYVVATGTTNGKIYVNVNNEDENLSLSDVERNILEGNVISTGAFDYTGLTRTSSTTFQVAPLLGWVVQNTYNYSTLPDVVFINYSGSTSGTTTPYLTTNDATFVLITTASTLSLQATFPTPQERRQNIYLGKVVHPSRTSILNVLNTVDFDVSPMAALRDLWTPIKLVNQNIVITPNGANLNINVSAGALWGNGIGWSTNQLNPNSVSIPAKAPATFAYRTQTGGTTGEVSLIDVGNYDVNGVVTPVPGTQFTTQRVYQFPTGLVRIQYGQVAYPTLAKALAGLTTETFVEFVNNKDNGILIGLITVKSTTTDLTNTADAIFTYVSKFGEILTGTAGGLATTTLQQAYDNSVQPEILTNSTLGAVSFRRGSAAETDNVIEVQNTTGANTFAVTGQGNVSGNSFNVKTYLYDSTNTSGTTNQVLFTSPSGVKWNNIDSIVTGLTNNKVIELSSGILSTVRINANNIASGNYSGVLSGTGNTTPGIYSVIAGGSNNTASGNTTSILGGDGNTALSCYSAVVGGSFNRVVDTSGYSVIGGGIYNRVTNLASLIGGGFNNTSSGNYSGIVGGNNNKVLADRSLVGGGKCNTASGTYSFIAGGQNNYSNCTNTFILGSNLTATTTNTTFVENLNVKNNIYDSLGSVGTTGNILIPTATGNQWRSVDNVISGSTSITSKLNITDFSTYSSTTNTLIGTKLNITDFSSYSANTKTTIDGKLNITDFSSYSSNTLTSINNKVIEVGSGVLSSVRINANNIASGNYSGVLSGTGNTASALYSSVLGGRLNIVTGSTSTIGGGSLNTITSIFSGVGGGCCNDVFSDCSFIGGGATNTASAIFTTIGGGSGNTISSIFSTAAGGVLNTASGNYASIGGGCRNVVGGLYGTVAGGRTNSAGGESSIVLGGQQNAAIFTGGAIAGGCLNTSNCFYVTIAGGCCNSSNGDSATIIGGKCNRSSGACSTISGGYCNTVSGTLSSIGGGCRNTVSGACSGLLGGSGNTVSNCFSLLIGGCRNSVSGTYNAIPAVANTLVGGINNTIITSFSGVTGINYVGYSFIGGGFCNTNYGTFSTISGGLNNTSCSVSTSVGGGCGNTSSARYSTVVGGHGNTASGNCAVTGGRLGVASSTGAVAFGTFNTASGTYSLVAGGRSSTASGYASAIAGGRSNTAVGVCSFVGGGFRSVSTGACSVVGGGCNNISSGIFSGVLGGLSGFTGAYSVVVGGKSNTGSGTYSGIVGGKSNTVSGAYSGILGGSGNTLTANNSFILGSDISGITSNTTYINSLALPLATSSSNDAISNFINFTNNNSQIYEDGNLHIHSRSANQSIWINTNNGQLNLLTQAPFAGANKGSGIAIGTTDLTGFVTISSGKTLTTAAAYGYLTTAGAGTYGGPSQQVTISLYAAQRIWGQEIDAFSDERMKDIIGDIKLDDAIDLVKKLNPIKYTWKDSDDKGVKSGYSAQQVSKAGFDHLISLIPKKGLEETIDEDGFVSPKDTQFSMNYDQVVPYHGRVIKHLLEKIETLEKEISDIKALLNK